MDFKNIPLDIIVVHILPKIDIIDFQILFKKSILLNDHKFINDYLLPTYLHICINNILYHNEIKQVYHNEIIIYIIKTFEYNNLIKFLNSIKFSYEEIDIWYEIIKKNDINILDYFIQKCNHCCSLNIFHVIINTNNIEIMNKLIKNNKIYPVLEHCLLILINENKIMWNYILYLILQNNDFKNKIYDEVYTYISQIQIDTTIYDDTCQYFYELSHTLFINNKKSIWLNKQLYIFQEILKHPTIFEAIHNYVIIIDDETNYLDIEDEIDDYDY